MCRCKVGPRDRRARVSDRLTDGWAGASDGDLLVFAEAQFDAFVTTDRNLPFQQNLARHNVAVIVLQAHTNRLSDLKAFFPRLLEILPQVSPGSATRISS